MFYNIYQALTQANKLEYGTSSEHTITFSKVEIIVNTILDSYPLIPKLMEQITFTNRFQWDLKLAACESFIAPLHVRALTHGGDGEYYI